MIATEITAVRKETPSISTVEFRWNHMVLPGQFVMVWIPGIGEIPMSLSLTGETKAITVKAYGPTSTALKDMNEGDTLYFRGPYGNSFTITGGDILLVGGGSGMASLRPLVREDAHGVVSARTAEELLFVESFRTDRVHTVTDDGTSGIRGMPVDQLKQMDLDAFNMIYVCGPELMLKSVMDHLQERNVRAEFSLERIMKCGIGICDSCSIDGYQLCRDGPVFSLDKLASMNEFGNTKLTESGRRVRL